MGTGVPVIAVSLSPAMMVKEVGYPPFTVTVAVCVRVTPFALAVTTFGSAAVELSCAVARPSESVGVYGWTILFPVPVAEMVTVAPEMGLPSPLRAVTAMMLTVSPLLAAIVVG